MDSVTPAALLRASPLPPLEARILLTHVLGWRHTQLITRSEEALDHAIVERRQFTDSDCANLLFAERGTSGRRWSAVRHGQNRLMLAHASVN